MLPHEGFLQRLFGSNPKPQRDVRLKAFHRLKFKPFSHGLVRILALDFFGPHAASPDSKFHKDLPIGRMQETLMNWWFK